MKRSSMKRILTALVTAGFLVGCSQGDAVTPSPDVTLRIHLDSEVVREAAMAVADSLRLTLRPVARKGGSAAAVDQPVSWAVEDESVVRLGEVQGTSTTIHGLAIGSTRVVAVAGAQSDTVIVSVLSPGSGGFCNDGGLSLARGQSITTTAALGSPLCLAPIAEDGLQYVLVPFNASSVPAGRLRVEVSATGIAGGSTGADAASADGAVEPVRANVLLRSAGHEDFAGEFDRRLREREARELNRLVTGASAQLEEVAALRVAASVPAVGSTMRLNVNADQTCTAPDHRTARVVAVSQRAIILAEDGNPSGGFTTSEYEEFAAAFDRDVYPTLVRNFGEPTDIDGNGRVMILFTRAVNELTSRGSDSYVAGFFFARDLFPATASGGFQSCPASNEGELLYLLVPDPTGSVNGNPRSKEDVGARTVGVIAHELQHLINASRRLRVLGRELWSEQFWLNEGLSHIAEELLFYATTPFGPGESITPNRLRGTVGATARFNEFQSSNFARVILHLEAPETASPLSGNGLATRGAVWNFLRYVADRYPGDEATLWRSLIDSEETGYSNLRTALGSSPMTWMHDWAVSLYAADIAPVPQRFAQESWSLRSLIQAMSTSSGVYPLKVDRLVDGSSAMSADLVAGGATYVHFSAPRSGSVRIEIRSGGATPPDQLRFTILRIR